MRLIYSGFEELADTLEMLPDAIDADLEESVGAGMDVVLTDASQRAPVDPENPGNLAQSMVRETTDRKRDVVEVSGGPDKDHWYGIFPEFGTEHQAAQPFLRPAFDTQALSALQAIARGIEGSIERAVR